MKIPTMKIQKVVLILLLAVAIAACFCSCTQRSNRKSFTFCEVYKHSFPVKPNKKAMSFSGNVKMEKVKYNKKQASNFCTPKKVNRKRVI